MKHQTKKLIKQEDHRGGKALSDRSIFSSVRDRSASKGGSTRCAIGLCGGDYILGCSYKRLTEDSAALSYLISEAGSDSIYAEGCGAYELAVALLAASAMGLSLNILDSELSPRSIIDTLSNVNNGFIIYSSDISKNIGIGNTRLRSDEFAASVSGARSSMKDFQPYRIGAECSVSFISEAASYCYSESAILFSARGFAEMSAITSSDHTLCDIDPRSPEGLICGLAACLLSGSTVTYCAEEYSFVRCASLSHPTRFFCTRAASVIAAAVLKSGSPITAPVPLKKLNIPCPFSAIRHPKHAMNRQRRLAASNIMRLGGELRRITVLGNCGIHTANTFADNGIFVSSLLSCPGCPFLALRQCFSKSPWVPPKGSIMDICDVQKGGVGKLTVSSPALCSLSRDPILHGNFPGCFRLDQLDGISLVTDLLGNICSNGSFYVKKRLDSHLFSKKSNIS